jgi:hypothetical protein
MRRLRFALITIAAAFLLIVAGPAPGARSQPVLRQGDHGPQVQALQWLLGQHKPSVFHGTVKSTFPYKPNGRFGQRTAHAIAALKFRLGYPLKIDKPIAGPYLLALLRGTKQRPPAWVIRATRRAESVALGTPTQLALKIRSLELHQLGVTEQPLGSNNGTLGNGNPDSGSVFQYQLVTGATGAAWCVSFQQWALLHGGAGTFAGDTASVYAAVDYATPRGWVKDKPKIGALVAFIQYDRYGHRVPGTGHMGYVVAVTAHGFSSVEGNASNRVLEQYHDLLERPMVFLYLPHITTP